MKKKTIDNRNSFNFEMGQIRRKEILILVMVGVIVVGGGLWGWGQVRKQEGNMTENVIGDAKRVRILENNQQSTQQITEKDSTQSVIINNDEQQRLSSQKFPEPNPKQSTLPSSQTPLPSASHNTNQLVSESTPYHIYSAMNPRLVLDVAKADDGSHDLILYQWQNSPNQEYYFKRVHDNFYHIVNAQSNEHMKKSQKIVVSTGVSKVKFQQQKEGDQLWQLVPAKNSNNSFFILSSQRLALDLNQMYAANGAQIILYEWSKNDNQVWFLRQNKPQFLPQQSNKQLYQQRLAQLLLKAMSVPDSINECITFQEMKRQMMVKNMEMPEWIARPKMDKPKLYEMPPQISATYHKLEKNKSLKRNQQTYQYNTKSQQSSQIKLKENHVDFQPQKIALQCAKHHTIAYIWYGEKQMPQDYQQLLEKCKNNVRVLNEKDFAYYVQKWNILQPIYAIDIDDFIIRQRINLLKLLYLYFQSGIYADFDTQINEECFQNVFADQIIWTSMLDENVVNPFELAIQEIIVPQESFMMITTKEHPQVKRMLQEEIMEHNQRGGQRWKQCSYRQCLIIQCQRHYRDNTYKKGFD